MLLMKLIKVLSVIVLALLLLFPVPGIAQSGIAGKPENPRIGIALSSGGAKGFAHIGVLKVLEEEHIPIHIVAGSSMGAVVGGLYAAGYTPKQIREIAVNTDWQALFNDHLRPSSRDLSTFISNRETYLLLLPIVENRPQLPAGLVDGQNISMLLYRLTFPYHDVGDFTRLPIPFGAVATELSTGKARLFTTGYLPDVIRASAAIPSIFKPVNISGELYIDGGVARSIPAEDARAMGADIVLVSDVGEPIKPVDSLATFVDILFQAMGFHQIESDTVQIKSADFYIRPDINMYSSFSYDKVEEMIQKGEEAARAMMPQLKTMIDLARIADRRPRPEISSAYNTPLNITDIEYRNMDSRLARQTEMAMKLDPPQTLTYAGIERKINRLYGTGLFSQISYRVRNDSMSPGGKILSLRFSYSEPDRLGISMRYDSRYKASLLLGAQLRNKLSWGDRFSARLRLGEVLGIATHYDVPFTLKPVVRFNVGVEANRSPIDFYSGGDRLATVEVDKWELLSSLSLPLFDKFELQAGIRTEFYSLNETVGNTLLFEESHFLLNGIATLQFDNLNRSYFPTRGQRLQVLAESSARQFLSEATFSQFVADWQISVPVLEGVNIRAGVLAGRSSTADLPLHYQFYLGGLTSNPLFSYRQSSFLGYSTQQLRGSNVTAVRSALQFHLGRDVYIQTGWNAAEVSGSATWDLSNFSLNHGFGISLGALTIAGPASLSFSTPDFKKNYAIKVDIGYTF